MEAEHCRRKGCDASFSPGNYNTTTTPAAEWRVATDAEEGRRASVGARRVLSEESLMEHETVKEAGLRREEVVALKVRPRRATARHPVSICSLTIGHALSAFVIVWRLGFLL